MKHCSVTSLWVQDELPDYVRLCINSFLAHGHNYTLFTYGKIAIPGVTVRDAREILPESYIWHDAATTSLAPFSDLFRWAWLKKEGGIWVDTDLACLKDTIPLDGSLYMCYEDPSRYYVSAACIKFPPNHRVTKTMHDLAYDPLTRQPWEDDATYERKKKFYSFNTSPSGRIERERRMPWSQSSTLGLTHAVRHYDLQCYIRSYTEIFPIHWRSASMLYTGDTKLKDYPDSWGIHLWGHELRKNSLSLLTSENCIMQELLGIYGK